MRSHFSEIISIVAISFLAFSNSPSSALADTQSISIDGSSTVFPITEAVAEEFRNQHGKIKVNIGVSGTGGGFKKFVVKEIDICNASRPIKASEVEAAQKNNITYTEIPVAYDGLTVVVNSKNTWATSLTVAELKKIWGADSKVKTWSDIREEWPNRPIKLYGPGTDSGTFDFFTETINGKSGVSRSDYVKSEDDNVLVTGVAGDLDSMGYFGFSYYNENAKKLKAVSIDNGKGAVAPSVESITNGTYSPLSRPIFIYVNHDAYKRQEVKTFLDFYLNEAGHLVPEVGYIALDKNKYKESLARLKAIK
ncbi:MAG: PstS family phosphate ABC transporter substrate-binding protein [Bdellovibrio sp.]|nr:PstS family phosphate ABC transporter substrate-binding protein [Bdellovibrio sp.]